MISKSSKRVKKRISVILAIVMLASVMGNCGAVLAHTNTAAGDNSQGQEAAVQNASNEEAYAGTEAESGVQTDLSAKGAGNEDYGLAEESGSLDVKAESNGTTVTVSWQPEEGKDYHYGVIYSYIDGQDPNNLSDPKETVIDVKSEADQFTETSITVEGLTYLNHYTFKVTAYDNLGQTAAVGTATVTPMMSTPVKTPGFKVLSGKGKVTLKWSAASQPSDDSNIVIWYRIYKNGKLLRKIKGTTEKSYSTIDKKAKELSSYGYIVRTVYRKDTPGQFNSWTDPDSKKAMNTKYALVFGEKKTIKRGPIRPIKYTFKLKSSAPYYYTYKGSSVAGHLKKGKKTFGIGALNTRYIIKVGKKNRWLPVKYTKNKKADYINGKKDYYSKEEKEAYVNARKIKSRTSYMIWVSAYTQRVTVFKKSSGKWKQHSCSAGDGNYLCSTGGLSTPTPTGKLHIWSKLASRHGHTYWSNFYSYTALHTCPSYAKGMGYPASNGGCVRIDREVAKWIYQNVPIDTTVLVY